MPTRLTEGYLRKVIREELTSLLSEAELSKEQEFEQYLAMNSDDRDVKVMSGNPILKQEALDAFLGGQDIERAIRAAAVKALKQR